MIVLVTGGRQYTGSVDILSNYDISILVHGGATGADSLADAWCVERGIPTARVNANWDFYGKKAGFIRNKSMLILRPNLCIAFPGGNGTKNMVELCKIKKIPIVFSDKFVYNEILDV